VAQSPEIGARELGVLGAVSPTDAACTISPPKVEKRRPTQRSDAEALFMKLHER
jgi:hypothetical protein